MGLGLEGAYGVAGGWDALHDIIAERKKDEILKYKQEEDRRQFDLQQQQLEESRKFREMQFQGLERDRTERNLDRDAAFKSLDEARKAAEQKQMADAIRARFTSLPGGTNVGATSLAQATQNGAVEASQFTPNKIDPANPDAPQTWKYAGSAAWQQHQEDQDARKQAAEDAANLRREIAGMNQGNRATQQLTPLQKATQTRLLANDWQRYTAPQRIIERQVSLMDVAIKQVDAGKPFGADEGILVSFERALDPNSVVRESEYARAGGGMALLDQLAGMVKRAREGGAAVPPQLLHQIVDLSRQFAASEKAYNAREKQRVSDVAASMEIDPTHVFGRDEVAPPPPPPAAAPGFTVKSIRQR